MCVDFFSPSRPPSATVPHDPFLLFWCSGLSGFWCTEAVFQRVEGVRHVSSGYMGGELANPSYKDVKSKSSGHAEVCRVVYDPAAVSLGEILEVFFRMHDPTQVDRQGNDVGPQYRSCIFLTKASDRETAMGAMEKEGGRFQEPLATELKCVTEMKEAACRFWPAEISHQDYFNTNPTKGYCRFVVHPKLLKVSHPKFQFKKARRSSDDDQGQKKEDAYAGAAAATSKITAGYTAGGLS